LLKAQEAFAFRHGAHSVSGGGRNRSRCSGAD
jgi:hypothetical protein